MSAPERIRGIEAPLPAGEHVRWQGSPSARAIAIHVFHLRKLALYFALLAAWRAAAAVGEPNPWAYFATGALALAVCLALLVAVLGAISVLCARTTVYAITDRRLVMRVGMVLPATVNIPLRRVESAGLKAYADGTGDVAITLDGTDRLAYFLLWPHARPWHYNPTHPALRCVPDPARVGEILRQAVAACAPGPLAVAPAPARTREPSPVPALASVP
ncbi:MAG TPA: photosynthetic complex putative assembly protein PuhB [Longimicrobium sp.]|nr:photosynthetic complex putative assembly protein PuhB [Longimicrobium sp.]